MSGGNASERGIALVTVLWSVFVLSALAAVYSAGARTEMNLARNTVENVKAEALADAGVYQGIAILIDQPIYAPIRTDGTVYAWSFAGGDVRLSVADENGKFDLNLATVEQLARLFEVFGLGFEESQAVAAAVADYRDLDEDPRPGGAEDPAYERAGLAYRSKDAPFERIGELSRVLGVTNELYGRLIPSITVHANVALPDPAVAPAAVLLALDESAHADTRHVQSDVQESPVLGSVPSTVDDSQNGAAPGARGSTFTIHSEGRTPGGAVFARLAIVRLTGGGPAPFAFYDWGQTSRRYFASADR